MTEHIDAECLWTIKERQPGQDWIVLTQFKNVITYYGLTALALASAGWLAPTYLVIETSYTTLSAGYNAGVSSISTVADPTIVGDTKITLSPGSSKQEVVTFTNKTGTGPYTFTLSTPTAFSHALGDTVVREPTVGDTLASVLNEAEYDPANFPQKRLIITSNYSAAVGQGTLQFFISGLQAANVFFAHVGLADDATIGSGNLHNYAPLGYNHNSTADLEIDVNYSMTV